MTIQETPISAVFPDEKADEVGLGKVEIIEKLSEMEHLRWMAHKRLAGFILGKEKDNDKKIHPDLIPYAELEPEIKQKDRDTIFNIPELYQSLQKNLNL